MTNRLQLSWKRYSSGYEIVLFDPNLVDFKRPEQGSQTVPTHGSLPAPKPILHGDHGEEAQHVEGNHLAQSQVVSGVGNQIEKFDPIEKSPELYLTFANTPHSTDGILKFATEYGLLGLEENHETVDAWLYHIKRMHNAILQWNHVRNDRPEAFATTYVSLCPYSGDSLKHSLQVGPSGALCLYLEPVNLLAAMWVQFAGAIAGATSFSPCQECKVWIDTVPGSNRPDKKYCSDACRMRAYRKRKASR